jgi:hypothetical protein
MEHSHNGEKKKEKLKKGLNEYQFKLLYFGTKKKKV